ncbi:MAG TPA: beta-propeller domain-containing protein, partial [Candidatus Methanomethylicus sp.]|nr:beta-propeller domain-containing protein [Candidatus Methanomethylicus sp.]
SSPTAPEIIGILKIPGYSSYLHPLGDSYVIGVGKEGSNLKLSLFDVSNVSEPREVAKFQLDYAYSDSEALNDHKAFLFDEQKGLLVLPVSWNSGRDWTYSQGAYVFNLTVDGGFVLKGVVNHQLNTNTSSWDYAVRRSLYIGNTLYTLSSEKLVMNDLASLALINVVELQPFGS